MKTTQKQRDAINNLKLTLRDCHQAGVRLFGMDNSLHATVSYDPSKNFHEQFQESSGGDSNLYEEVVSGGVYLDSGGW